MRKTRIIIISLISVLVLVIATFAVLYFATDVFKSDKEIFYKKISQMDLSKLMDTTQSDKYQERLKNEKYENKGELSIKANMGNEMDINESFKYISLIDNASKRADSEVTINKEGNALLTINYLRNGDLYGLQFKDIVSQYIVLENNNLKEFIQKLGIQDVTSMPDKIDLSENQSDYSEILDEEELKQIANKYIKIIIDQIPEKNYSKVEDGYKLTIDLKTMKNIVIKVISTLKDDEQVFNLISSIIGKVDSSMELDFEAYKEAFDNAIDELLGEDEIEENFDIIEIVTYKDRTIYFKIGIDSEDGKTYVDGYVKHNDDEIALELKKVTETSFENNVMKVTVNKNINTTENELCEIELIVEEDEEVIGNLNIEIKRDGNLESNNIQNSILVSAMSPENDLEINIECNNSKTFDSSIEVKEFTASNHVAINDLDYTQISNLLTNLGKIIPEKTGLNVAEIIGGAGVGIISTVTLDSEKTIALTGMTTGLAINIILKITNVNEDLLDKAQNSANRTKEMQVYEAMALAKTEFLSMYYREEVNITEITEQYVKETIEYYLDDEMSVNVTKIEGKEEYIVTVDGIELDEDRNKLDLSVLNN